MVAKITELYAWLATHEDGTEGIIASIMPGLGATPLITSRRNVAETMYDCAHSAARFGMPETAGRAVCVRMATFRLVELDGSCP